MINDYFKIIIPCISKFYFSNKKDIDRYKGNAILIIEKNTNKLVFNTLIFNENQTIWGADNGKFGDGYKIKKIKELFDFRLKSFNTSQSKGKKNRSIFKSSIKDLNNLILKNKLTIKDVDAFISGSHSSGGLKNPNNDPIRMNIDKDYLPELNCCKLKNTNENEWKIFSLISNINNKSNNNYFVDNVTNEYINKLEEREIKEIFNLDWKVIPWGFKGEKKFYVNFKKSFISQNYDKFENTNYNKDLLMLPKKYLNSKNIINNLNYWLNFGDKNFVKKELRNHWTRIIESTIKKNKYETDFVKQIKNYDRAHIIENNFVINFILNESNKSSEKEKIIKMLFNENNFLLLDKTLHNYWDKNKIIIDKNGDIFNKKLDENEFNIITNGKRNIYSIYNNVINKDREKLLNERINFN